MLGRSQKYSLLVPSKYYKARAGQKKMVCRARVSFWKQKRIANEQALASKAKQDQTKSKIAQDGQEDAHFRLITVLFIEHHPIFWSNFGYVTRKQSFMVDLLPQVRLQHLTLRHYWFEQDSIIPKPRLPSLNHQGWTESALAERRLTIQLTVGRFLCLLSLAGRWAQRTAVSTGQV